MLTLFTLPKPFAGHTGVIQRNAIRSWALLHPDAQVILLGEGADEAPALGAEHADVVRNEHGTPLLNDAFARAETLRRNDVLVFVNADIVLFDDLVTAVERVRRSGPRFLVVGESWDLRLDAPLAFEPGWDERLRGRGRKRGADAIDWFAFTPGLYDGMPAFAIGRTAFDNWLVWHARHAGALVVDATPVVRPVHQQHDYGHFIGGLPAIRVSDEARRNRDLLGGGRQRLYSRFDATHVLTPRGLRRNLGAPLRWKETSRRAAYKLRRRLPTR